VDFTPEPEQQAVADVVNAVLDRENTWEALVSGSVIALGVPDRLGGDGVGLPEIALATLGLGLVPLVDLASEAQQDRFLDGVGKGAILTAALNEPGNPLPERPMTTLRDGRLNGTKTAVPYAAQANWMVVSTDAGVVVVSPKADGVRLVPTPTSSGAEEAAVEFRDVAVGTDAVLAGASVRRLNQLTLAGIGAYAAGLVAGAVRLTADYVTNRHQFGRPLATFQAVAQQLADVYIASRTLTLASTSVVWRLSQDRDADEDLDVLAYWLSAEAPPAMQTCHHLHGGMGMDVTYPMHRYYSSIKDLTRLLGGPAHRLDLVAGRH
jgi:alkylation response protein AidB-like acyl-CoA dehydrogenase